MSASASRPIPKIDATLVVVAQRLRAARVCSDDQNHAAMIRKADRLLDERLGRMRPETINRRLAEAGIERTT